MWRDGSRMRLLASMSAMLSFWPCLPSRHQNRQVAAAATATTLHHYQEMPDRAAEAAVTMSISGRRCEPQAAAQRGGFLRKNIKDEDEDENALSGIIICDRLEYTMHHIPLFEQPSGTGLPQRSFAPGCREHAEHTIARAPGSPPPTGRSLVEVNHDWAQQILARRQESDLKKI